jgi:DNA-binding transcriptional regulator LsrR (DeoR family)
MNRAMMNAANPSAAFNASLAVGHPEALMALSKALEAPAENVVKFVPLNGGAGEAATQQEQS